MADLQLRHFDISEFDSPDVLGSGDRMKVPTLIKLDNAREIADVAFVVTSGYRTPLHNESVGGVSGSSHMKGYAVDIEARTSEMRMKIVAALILVGFNRIGIGRNFIHVDDDPEKSPDVMWHYY